MRSHGWRASRVGFASVVVALCAGLLGTWVAVPSASAQGGARYVVAVPVCPRARPDQFACNAVALRRVGSTTPGAVVVRRAAGASSSGPAGGLTPADLARAYGFDPTGSGADQTVAIIDWGNDPTIATDLNTFDSHYDLPLCTTTNGCFTKLNQRGKPKPLPPDEGTAIEISLDVEAVHAVCQRCKIVLIEADAPTDANLDVAVNEAAALGANEISTSYGAADPSGPSASDSAAYNHPGVVITASAGDDGYLDFDRWVDTPHGGPAANPSAPQIPASLATVVAVGGTALYLNQDGTRRYETVWNENGTEDALETGGLGPQGASGGGCSIGVNAPIWQQQLPTWSQTACGSRRLATDVSAVADPYTGFDTYNTSDHGPGWETIGGTSLSSPIIAAIYALAGGSHGISYPAQTLYTHIGTGLFYDVTVGGNGFCNGAGATQCGNQNQSIFHGVPRGVVDCDFPASGTTPNPGDLACDAAPGYDGPTGVGTPIGIVGFATYG